MRGGTKGIGKAICRQLAEQHARIASAYGHDRHAAEATGREFHEQGWEANVYQCDVTEPEQVSAMVDHVVKDFGRIDVLVNNAGITSDKTVLKMEIADWHRVLGTDLSSCFYPESGVTKDA